LSLDLRQVLRRLKPERQRVQLTPRSPDHLIEAASLNGRLPLVPDTNVYINDASGTLPAPVAALLDRSLQFHCSVCLSEIATGVAAYSPISSSWPKVRDHYAELFDAIPDSRILVPDDEVWVAAGVVAGTLARTQGLQVHQRRECLHDALILLTAAKAGLPVLTANRVDFDLIQQVTGIGQFVYY
jgi:predicted nucleic acid-binding protein